MLFKLCAFLNQSFFLSDPPLTEKNLPDQAGRVHLITGGYAGVGFELASILYRHNATVYVAGRSSSKANTAIEKLKSDWPESRGKLCFLQLDLADLTTIKPAAEEFLSKEMRLDVLVNNAGVMHPPKDQKTKQGYDLQLGTNCLGPFAFTMLLLPLLKRTADSSPSTSVRVLWVSSLSLDLQSPPNGVGFDDSGAPASVSGSSYGASKAGDRFLASEFARRYADSGVISLSVNPGNLSSELQRHAKEHTPVLAQKVLNATLMYEPIFGAYTELYAGWSEDAAQKNGAHILPWGRVGLNRPDIEQGLKRRSEGGLGTAEKFWDWCERESRTFV